MKNRLNILITFLFIIVSGTVSAQNDNDAQSLVKQGVQFNNEGKYTEAIEKFNQVLKLDTANASANYGIAYSLLYSNRGNEGIPHLEKVIKANSPLTAWAYDLLGSIYDQDHDSEKAIAAYKAGIKIDPRYQPLQYNLGLVYFRDKDYAEAENCAIEAIKCDQKNANSLRMYALVCFHQNKRAAALLGFCSFILLEPNTPRSAEAYGNIQHILKGGILKPVPGQKTPQATDAFTVALNRAITNGAAEAAKNKYTSQADLLAAQLKAIFIAIGQVAEKQNNNDFFSKYFAAYFYQLANSPDMPAFARLVSLSTPESTQWAKDNPQKMTDLDNWVKIIDRVF